MQITGVVKLKKTFSELPILIWKNIMPLKRFKLLRQDFSFRSEVSEEDIRWDPAARIRPLLNILKVTGGKYIDLGRDVALDEAIVACRSRFGRHLIVYNPRKPGGKYHFKLYMMCCATTWVAVNYRLHSEGVLEDRLDGVSDEAEVAALGTELSEGATIRQIVLEVVRSIYETKRVVNTDNFYTSVQLLQAMKLKGLFGRDTVRGSSKRFPKHVMLEKKTCTRGEYRQGVSVEHKMLAASWCDGSIVSIMSNADASESTTVSRRVANEQQEFVAPKCVKNYNKHMQGVDRLDKLRARFSISDGHSFQKWDKKLAMALVDIARCNAYLTRKMVYTSANNRDPHCTFMMKLATELISGKWATAPSETRILYSNPSDLQQAPQPSAPISRAYVVNSPFESSKKACTAVASKQVFSDKNRKRRQCIVCRWEDRYPIEVTDYCVIHGVCLCKGYFDSTPAPYMCPQSTWTCRVKFHQFYQKHHLFSAKGRLRKTSQLYKLKMALQSQRGPTVASESRSVVRQVDL